MINLKTTYRILGLSIGAVAYITCACYYDWKLSLIIWLAITSNNLEGHSRKL